MTKARHSHLAVPHFCPNVGRGAAVRKRMGISTSAEVDLRLCLKNLPPFEKGGRKLSADYNFVSLT